MSKLLDVAMIVKNEAENLPACLESLKPLEPILGGIYIYDTGSTDGTQNIARSYGATLQQGYWDNDFSRARNESIQMCESKWVLIVDADDRLTANVGLLKRALLNARPDLDCFRVSVIIDHGHQTEGTLRSLRILRRQRLRYIGNVHEIPARADGTPAEGAGIESAVLALQHLGYSAETLPAKMMRNLELSSVKADHARSAGDTDALCAALIDQARSFSGIGRSDEALECYREMAGLNRRGRYFTWGLELYADELLDAGHLDEASRVIELLADRGSAEGIITLFQARLALARGDYADSLTLARRINQQQAAIDFDHSTSSIIHTRMMAALHCQEFEEALACLLQLVVSHGVVSKAMISLLIKLWSTRPVEGLAEILSDSPADFIPQIAQELATQDGIGPEVAQSLLSRVEPELAAASSI